MKKLVDINDIHAGVLTNCKENEFMIYTTCEVCGAVMSGHGYTCDCPEGMSYMGMLFCCKECMPEVERRNNEHRNSNV